MPTQFEGASSPEEVIKNYHSQLRTERQVYEDRIRDLERRLADANEELAELKRTKGL